MKKLFKLNSWLLIFAIYFSTNISSIAHQPDISSTTLLQNSEGEWMLRIACSASALEYEVKTHFAQNPYKTKEEFDVQALEHIKNNISLKANNSIELELFAPVIKVGHESQVFFKIANMPSEINILDVQNSAFQDIHRSQNIVMVLRDGFAQNQFVLNKANDNFISLKAQDNNWVLIDKPIENNSWIIIISAALMLLVILILPFRNSLRQKLAFGI